MNLTFLVFSAIALAITTLTVERTMRVFFEKRRTSFITIFLSYLFLWVALVLQVWWSQIASITVFIYFLALVVVSFNYESVAMKRIAAVAGGHYVMLSVTIINTAILNHFPIFFDDDNISLLLLFTSLFIYCVSLTVFSLFTHIKKQQSI
jgi:hypothetical protein